MKKILSIILFITFILTFAVQAQVALCFMPADSFAIGTPTPSSITKADFNGDSIVDIAASGDNGNRVSIMLGTGNGSFATAQNFGLSPLCLPAGITHADFNGDGKMDLATADYNNSKVSVLLGNGNGTFSTILDFVTGVNPITIISADFNGDGHPDIATPDEGLDSISILLGDGTGGMSAPFNFAAGISPFSIISGDFNGDGKLDIAASNDVSHNISVLLGNGLGGFGATVNFATGNNPRSIITADFNGDGHLDLVTANEADDNVSILLGDGTGHFAAAVNFTTGTFTSPRSVISGDFNGDGHSDLSTANEGLNNISVITGNGNGGFAAPVFFAVQQLPRSIITADFNGDHKADLAVANYNSGDVSVLLNCNVSSITALPPTEEFLSIYPNPFISQTVISVNGQSPTYFGKDNISIKITDLLGKEIETFSFSGNQFMLEKGTMQSGIYFVQIIDEKRNSINRKIVIQ